jgi:hypothetical protein
MSIKKRRIGSVKNELIKKSKEAMLTAVQIFNNPNIQFKSESFMVLAIISWTYLLHAYYRDKKIEYRYFEQKKQRKKFDTTKHGAYKYWEFERCLDNKNSPIDKVTSSNLKFLIGLRNEIEHQMTTRIDDLLSARFQACCLNYNTYLKKLFPSQHGIEKHLSFSLQFSSLSEKQLDQLMDYKDLPQNIATYIQNFDKELSEDDFNDSKFSYRVFFVPKTANRKGQADKVIEFIPANSAIAKGMNREYVIVKDKEKIKYSAGDIWKGMQKIGHKKFGVYQHTKLWQTENAKDPAKGYGITIVKTWYWYDSWKSFVIKHCEENKDEYL